MMRGICARHGIIPAVPRAAFRSTENHYAHGNVLLIGEYLRIFEMAQAHLCVLVVKSTNVIAVLWPCLARFSASFARASVPLEIIFMHSKLMPSISAGESSSYLDFLFFNLPFNI